MTLPRALRALLRPALAAAVALGALCGAPAPLRAADVTLGIRSLNPDAGVFVGACCGDVCTLQVIPTPYDIVCPAGSAVNLSAPPTSGVGENEAFTEWRWGTPPSFFTANQVTQITVTGNGSVTAVYGTPPPVVTHPDFAVDSIVLTPASPIEGTTFTAAVTVSNHGESHLGLGYLAIWKDRADAPACSSTKDAFNAFSIPAGESRTLTFTGLLAGPGGQPTFRAYADYNCGFAEVDEADNHGTLAYTVRPRWTLDVRSSTPSSGVPVIVGAADTLGRTDGTTPFSRFYADASSLTLEVPPSLPSGNLFQHWLRDGAWYADTRLVTVEMLADHIFTAVYAPPPIPDFSVSDVTVMPASPTAGYAFSASVTVRNTGTVPGDAGTLAVWADKVSNPNCNWADADFRWIVGALEAGESRTYTFTSLGPVASGTRYLRAHVDAECETTELSDTNNQYPKSYLVVARETKTVTVGTLDGRSADIAHTMDVSGKTTGRTPFTRRYPTGSNVTLTAPATLPASEGVFQKWVGLEPTLAPDPAVTLLMNVDHGVRAVYVGPGVPDFAVTGIVLDPPDPPAGGTFAATVTIANVGTGRGVPGTVMLFPDRGYAAGCWAWTPYGPGYIPDLAAGASLTRTVAGIPAGTRGAKTLLAFVDDFCETDEPDEGNNQFFLPYEAANAAPVLGAIGDRSVAEGAILSFTVAATDANGDPLMFEATGLPDGAGFDPATRTFTWTLGYDAAGSYPGVRFTVTDGEATDEETITIAVAPTNRPPLLDPVGDRSGTEGEELAFTVTASDPDGDTPLTLEAANLPPWAAFEAETGFLHGTPGFYQAGRHEGIVFTVTDPSGAAATETIALEIAEPTGGLVFQDDFSDPAPAVGAGEDPWLPLAGAWNRANGVYTATSGKLSGLTRVALLDPETLPLGAGAVQARVKLTGTMTSPLGPNALIVFGFVDPGHYRWVRLRGASVQIGQAGEIDGIPGGKKRGATATLRTGSWYRITVRIEPDGWVRVLKGKATKPLVEYRFATAEDVPSVVPGGVGLATSKAKAVFDDVVVWEDSALAPPPDVTGYR